MFIYVQKTVAALSKGFAFNIYPHPCPSLTPPQPFAGKVVQVMCMRAPDCLFRSKPKLLVLQLLIWTGTMLLVQMQAHVAFGRPVNWLMTLAWGTVMAAAYTFRPRTYWSR